MASKFFSPAPSPQRRPHYSRSPSSLRRYPLTPSTVTPPAISTHNSSVSRQDTTIPRRDSGGAKAATALLAKVASIPSSRRSTPNSSPLPSPSEKSVEVQYQQMVDVLSAESGPQWVGYEALKYWDGSKQRDGYISFPDFERFHGPCESHVQQSNEREVVRQGAKT